MQKEIRILRKPTLVKTEEFVVKNERGFPGTKTVMHYSDGRKTVSSDFTDIGQARAKKFKNNRSYRSSDKILHDLEKYLKQKRKK